MMKIKIRIFGLFSQKFIDLLLLNEHFENYILELLKIKCIVLTQCDEKQLSFFEHKRMHMLFI